MTAAAALAATAILTALAVFQAALAAGAPLGRLAWGGGHEVLPAGLRVGSVVAIAIYALIGAILLQQAGLVMGLPAALAEIGIWVAVGYLALGVPMNAVSRSRPERVVMTPVVAVLLGLALTVALGGAA